MFTSINTFSFCLDAKGDKNQGYPVYFCNATGFLGGESELPPVRQLIRPVPRYTGH